MEFNKFISTSMMAGLLLLVACGDEQKKEADKATEVPNNTVTSDLPKTDTPATTEPAPQELPKVEVAPAPAPEVAPAPAPEVAPAPALEVTPAPAVETPPAETKPEAN